MADEAKAGEQGNTATSADESGKSTLTAPASEQKPLTEAKPAEQKPVEFVDFKVPEGFNTTPESMAQFKDFAKGLGLDQVKAQSVLDMAAKHAQATLGEQQNRWSQIREEWVEGLKEDKDFGGQKFGETVERAKRALKSFGTPELNEFLDETGYGDNPEIIKLLAKIDKAVGEDKAVNGSPSIKDKSAEEVLYPNLPR